MLVVDAEIGLSKDEPGVELVEDHVDGGNVMVVMEVKNFGTVMILNFIFEASLLAVKGDLN